MKNETIFGATIPYNYSIEYITYLFDDETFYEHKILR